MRGTFLAAALVLACVAAASASEPIAGEQGALAYVERRSPLLAERLRGILVRMSPEQKRENFGAYFAAFQEGKNSHQGDMYEQIKDEIALRELAPRCKRTGESGVCTNAGHLANRVFERQNAFLQSLEDGFRSTAAEGRKWVADNPGADPAAIARAQANVLSLIRDADEIKAKIAFRRRSLESIIRAHLERASQ